MSSYTFIKPAHLNYESKLEAVWDDKLSGKSMVQGLTGTSKVIKYLQLSIAINPLSTNFALTTGKPGTT